MSKSKKSVSDGEGLAVKVHIPPIDEQRRIAIDLRACDAELAALKRIEEYLLRYRNDALRAVFEGDVAEPGLATNPADDGVKEALQLILNNRQHLLDEDGQQCWRAVGRIDSMVAEIQRTMATSQQKQAESHSLLKELTDCFGSLREAFETTETSPGKPARLADDLLLTINLKSREVGFKGKTYVLDDVHVRILDVLNKANGHPVTRKKMRKSDELLKDEEHMERHIKKIPLPFRNLIRSSGEGYWLDVTKLA